MLEKVKNTFDYNSHQTHNYGTRQSRNSLFSSVLRAFKLILLNSATFLKKGDVASRTESKKRKINNFSNFKSVGS